MKKIILLAVLIVPLTLWMLFFIISTTLELLCENIIELADKIESKITHK